MKLGSNMDAQLIISIHIGFVPVDKYYLALSYNIMT